MPHKVDWYIDQKVIFWCLSGDKVPLSDIEEASTLINKMTDESSAPLVHTMIEVNLTPDFKLSDLPQALVHLNNPRTGWTLRYINNRVLEMWAAIISSQKQIRFRNFHAIEECWEFLKSVDQSIPKEPLNLERIEEIRNRVDEVR